MVTKSYRAAYERSLEQPAEFWLEAAEGISWPTPPRQALDSGRAPLYDWFPDGVLNTSYNALDRHVAQGRGEQDALVYDSAMLGIQQSYTYAELTDLVARFAGVLRRSGVGKGDRVVIYMPMIPEAVDRDAGHRTARRRALGRLRRLRPQGTCRPHPRRRPRGGGDGVRRHRAVAPD